MVLEEGRAEAEVKERLNYKDKHQLRVTQKCLSSKCFTQRGVLPA